MSLADPTLTTAAPATSDANAAASRSALRDPRLDFFRGIAMFIILIAHVPGNWLAMWIPARFGFSDATEIFVFCSGMASAIAFGKVFATRGWALGAARVAFRCWQVYWAHIGLFLAIAATMAALNASGALERDYIGQLNLHPFFNNPERNLMALMTLTYVPNYFDILPMYLVILAMMPFFVALVWVHRGLAALVVVTVWAFAQADLVYLPAEPWSAREWFFNPFGWQLIFFTGFAFMAGWLPAPPVDRRLVLVALAIVLLTLPFAYFRLIGAWDYAREWRSDYALLIAKTDFGLLRYVHFLSLAYLAWVAVGPRGVRLIPSDTAGLAAEAWRRVLAVIMKVGQQSLAVFITSMFLARIMGTVLDVTGRNHLSMLLVNAAGALLLVAVAYGAGWFKSQPWRKSKG
ncbi:OpgC protein [Roseivivax sp. THAF40]|uniref:OpgC family protein n=1 Tax=unclassified Roseivivax TaxID=2639302 RepID=UPI00126812FC|nr:MULTISPECIES: OpgC domain-containing protein [unclassified Roseivivax]QFS83483.1 OpgC protein [Roseivivax sp. THAF197b]QFT47228.1 OpgC protein [Roseivivax sp. THAF40]